MAKQTDEQKVELMDWQDVRKVLQSPKSRTIEPDSDEQKLRMYFGNSRFEELRNLSQRADEIREQLGNVILLPGIMGSHLSVVESDGDEDRIWINMWRLIRGGMKELRLKSDGKTNVNGKTVKATGLIKWYYALALETLQAAAFPYDWRLNICDSADKLAEFVKNNYAGQQVHFVAHSMGGLVVRNFVRQYNDLWNDVKGRLVMLGTPNAGSFSAIQGLMGKASSIKKLAAFDICQNSKDILKIIGTFQGLYQLCPKKLDNSPIYEKTFWKNFPDVLFDDYLKHIPKFHQDLLDAKNTTIDANRMTYIAGIGYETPNAIKVLDNGEYDFDITLDGDGTVSHDLGLLENVSTYYIEESHGDLPNNHLVLKATKDILQYGITQELTTQKPIITRSRSIADDLAVDYELEQVESVARQIRDKEDPEPVMVLDAEKTLLRALMGAKEEVGDELELVSSGETRKVKPIELELKLAFGDITELDEPIIVVGQYENLPTGGAGGAVNEKINNLIELSNNNAMVGMELGKLFFVPLSNQKTKLKKNVENILLAGMGQSGRFSREDLRYLMMNVTLAVVSWNYDRFATVAIGASIETFSIERAIRSIWQGISDSVERFPVPKKKITLTLVEINENRQKQIKEILAKFNKKSEKIVELEFENLKIKVDTEPQMLKTPKRTKSRRISRLEEMVTRVNVKRIPGKTNEVTKQTESGIFNVSAFTSNAAIPVRDIPVNDKILDSLIDKLRYAPGYKNQEKYGKLLHSILIPEDFQSVIDTDKALTLVLNREASQIPWEMICFGGTGRTSNFGVDLRITRKFSSSRVGVAGAPPPLNKQFKALIIADPAPEPELQLAGARREGFQLEKLFRKLQLELKGKIDLQFQARIGHEQCDIVEILSLIFNEDFDLVHFAGHGTFDINNASNTGWVFSRDIILSAREIFRLRRVPRLVFANACFSAGLHTSKDIENLNLQTTQSSESLAGLAEAFFDQGIENYIGSGWQVNDEHAVTFAKAFYEQTIKEKLTLGMALREARMKISSQYEKNLISNDTTWGAYQHYGNAYAQLVQNGED